MTVETVTDCRVWIGCLASFASGRPFGEWVDVSADVPALRADIVRVLAASPELDAEEWMWGDFDGLPSYFGEYEDLETLCGFVRELHDYVEDGGDAAVFRLYAAQLLLTGDELDGAAEACRERFAGVHQNPAAFAVELMEQGCCELPERPKGHRGMWLPDYVDWALVGRDLLIDDYWCEMLPDYLGFAFFRNE
jgi:antirestriction protein